MYVPIDYDHLAKGVNELFNFMASLNMAHASKVGMDLRNDNVSLQFEEGIEETVKWYLDNQEWMDNVTSGDYQKYYEDMYKK